MAERGTLLALALGFYEPNEKWSGVGLRCQARANAARDLRGRHLLCDRFPKMTLARFTSLELIAPRMQSRDAATAVAELSTLMRNQGRIENLPAFSNAVIKREQLGSTAISAGCAIPHARVASLDRLSFALGRSTNPLPWFGQGSNPVRLVFLLAVPENDARTYLEAISGLARLSQDPFRMEGLIEASDQQEMFDILHQVHLRHVRPVPARI
jgi:mannitol/fructose-specific phosphotransferase system IIA component (Ntr-type)